MKKNIFQKDEPEKVSLFNIILAVLFLIFAGPTLYAGFVWYFLMPF